MAPDLSPLSIAYEDTIPPGPQRQAAIALDALAILCREYGAEALARRLFLADLDLDGETSGTLDDLLDDELEYDLPRRGGSVIPAVNAAWTRAIAALAALTMARQARRRHLRDIDATLRLRAHYGAEGLAAERGT